MKNYLLLFTLTVSIGKLLAQKPVIDSTVYEKWPSVGSPAISDDGKYVTYSVNKTQAEPDYLVLQAASGNWKMEFRGVKAWHFTSHNQFIYVNASDSIYMIIPGSSSIEYITQNPDYRFSQLGTVDWLAYKIKTDQQLVLRHLPTGKEKKCSSVIRYWFDDDAKNIVIEKKIKNDMRDSLALYQMDLYNGKMVEIWKGSGLGNVQFDENSGRIVFDVKNGDARSWWYYQEKMLKAISFMSDQPAVDDSLTLGNFLRFSNDGVRAFFMFKEEATVPKLNPDAVSVNVWSYLDGKLQSNQKQELSCLQPKEFLGVVSLDNHRIIRLEQQNEKVFSVSNNYPGNYLIIENIADGNYHETHWNIKSQNKVALVSTIDGSRRQLRSEYRNMGMSDAGKFILFYDTRENQYMTYEIASGVYRNISHKIPWPLNPTLNMRYDALGGYGIAGWMKNDEALLIYDQYDIWQVDPLAKKAPINLTHGYCRRMHVELRCMTPFFRNPVFVYGDKLILSGFYRDTKENGFFAFTIGDAKDPELLSKGPYTYYAPQKKAFSSHGMEPVKALNADRYLVQRESTTDYPNYFVTSDFRTFIPISDLQPQRVYNWMTTDLHTWKSLDGQTLQGVLYKPENFDPNKKYPVIFYYYELLSDDVNSFHKPEYSDGRLNIAWYVSNGYLVFTPDVHFKIGEPMQSSYNCIVSAAEYVSGFPFVNAARMGIQGISFGGMQTNYLVTHTNLFAAACSASAPSDFISYYGSQAHDGGSAQGYLECGQTRIAAMLWERPDWYINNSPVLNAHKVKTPLLMMHTSVDGVFPFGQALELFTDLRRLGKRAWLLEYQDGNHGLWGKPAKDFSFRMSQFFDHYLKDKAAPVWMTRGVPSARKGIDSGLEYDTEIKTPGKGLLTPQVQLKVDSLMIRKPLTITFR